MQALPRPLRVLNDPESMCIYIYATLGWVVLGVVVKENSTSEW